MRPRDNEVKLGSRGKTKVIRMRHAPRVGMSITVEGEAWTVLSVSYEVPYRIPSMSFMVTGKAA